MAKVLYNNHEMKIVKLKINQNILRVLYDSIQCNIITNIHKDIKSILFTISAVVILNKQLKTSIHEIKIILC